MKQKKVRFTRNSMYENNIEKPNVEDANENCRFCDKSFKKKHLKTHLKTVQKGLKPEKESKSTSNSKKEKEMKILMLMILMKTTFILKI